MTNQLVIIGLPFSVIAALVFLLSLSDLIRQSTTCKQCDRFPHQVRDDNKVDCHCRA